MGYVDTDQLQQNDQDDFPLDLRSSGVESDQVQQNQNTSPPVDPVLFDLPNIEAAPDHWPPELWLLGVDSDHVQPEQNASPQMDPLLLDVQDRQAEQGQDQVDSTSLEGANSNSSPIELENTQGEQAENPPGDAEPGETFPIPSVIDTDPDRKNVPYVLQRTQMNLAEPSVRPKERLLICNQEMEDQIEKSRNFRISSEPGETFPIPSIKDVKPDTSDGPYEPCEERFYTLLVTRLIRTEAKQLRKQIRYSGWDAIYTSPWIFFEEEPNKGRIGWQFRRNDNSQLDTLTYICGGNQEGIRQQMRQEGKTPWDTRRIMMIVQRDGGEVRVDGLVAKAPKGKPTTVGKPTTAALNLFDQFEV